MAEVCLLEQVPLGRGEVDGGDVEVGGVGEIVWYQLWERVANGEFHQVDRVVGQAWLRFILILISFYLLLHKLPSFINP